MYGSDDGGRGSRYERVASAISGGSGSGGRVDGGEGGMEIEMAAIQVPAELELQPHGHDQRMLPLELRLELPEGSSPATPPLRAEHNNDNGHFVAGSGRGRSSVMGRLSSFAWDLLPNSTTSTTNHRGRGSPRISHETSPQNQDLTGPSIPDVSETPVLNDHSTAAGATMDPLPPSRQAQQRQTDHDAADDAYQDGSQLGPLVPQPLNELHERPERSDIDTAVRQHRPLSLREFAYL